MPELQCHQMLEWMESPGGKLIWAGVSSNTNHSPGLDSPACILYSAQWETQEIRNDYVYFAPAYQKEGEGVTMSSHCSYTRGRGAVT